MQRTYTHPYMYLLAYQICRIHAISLGQGQGPVAEKMISAAALNGDWVFLQVRRAKLIVRDAVSISLYHV